MTASRFRTAILAALSTAYTIVPAPPAAAVDTTYEIRWIDASGREGSRQATFGEQAAVHTDGDAIVDVIVELTGAPVSGIGPPGTIMFGNVTIRRVEPLVRARIEIILDAGDVENPNLRAHFGMDSREGVDASETTNLPLLLTAPVFVTRVAGETGFEARATFEAPGPHLVLFGGAFSHAKEGAVRAVPTYVEARLAPVPTSLRVRFLPDEEGGRNLTLFRGDTPTTVNGYVLMETLERKIEASVVIEQLPGRMSIDLQDHGPFDEEILSEPSGERERYVATYETITYAATEPVDHARVELKRWDWGANTGGGDLFTNAVVDARDIPATDSLQIRKQTRRYNRGDVWWDEEQVRVENNAPIGTVEFGLAQGREVAWASEVPDGEEYLKIHDVATLSSAAGRIYGLEAATIDTGDPLMLSLRHAESPMRLDVHKDFLLVDGHIRDLPAEISLVANVPAEFEERWDEDELETTSLSFESSSEIGEVYLHATDELTPVMSRAEDVYLTARGIPTKFGLQVTVPEEDTNTNRTQIGFQSKAGDLDSFEISMTDGRTTTPRFAEEEDGIAIVDLDDGRELFLDHDPYAVWARLRNVQGLWADVAEDCVTQPPDDFDDDVVGYRRCNATVDAHLTRSEPGDVRIYTRGIQVIPGSDPDAWKETWSDLRVRDLARDVTIDARTVEERWTSEFDSVMFDRTWTTPYADTLLSDITLDGDAPSGPLTLETNAGMRDRLDLRITPLPRYLRLCNAVEGAGWNESGACIGQDRWEGSSFLLDASEPATLRLDDCVEEGTPRCSTRTETRLRGQKMAFGMHDGETQSLAFDTDREPLTVSSRDVVDRDLVAVVELPPGFWMDDRQVWFSGHSIHSAHGEPNCPRRTKIEMEVFLPWYLSGAQIVADIDDILCRADSPVF